MKLQRVFIGSAVAIAIATSIVAASASQQAAGRMRDLYGALSVLLPYSLDSEPWESPAPTPRRSRRLSLTSPRTPRPSSTTASA